MFLSPDQRDAFRQEGFLVFRQMVPAADCNAMRDIARAQLERAEPPVEYEADVGYAGAPSRDGPGGRTVRRLLKAYGRDPRFAAWARDARVVSALGQIFEENVCLALAHHNCVMTKHPNFGTATGWHRDIRYWSFARPDLVSVWLALGDETADNGGLRIIPASHRLDIGRAQLDDLDFLRPDVPENQRIVAQGRTIELRQGDVLFFHSGIFHAAGRNNGDDVKMSVVYAYRGESNLPTPGSRSAVAGDVPLGR